MNVPRNPAPPHRPARRRPRRRRGISLVETVAVVAAVALLAGLAGTTLASLLRADVALRTRAAQSPQLGEFAARLRSDLARATEVEWRDGDRCLRLSLPGAERVQYRLANNRWERHAAPPTGDPAASSALTAAWPVPPQAACTVAPAQATAGDLLSIRLATPPGAAGAAPGPSLEVIVRVGRDQELLHP